MGTEVFMETIFNVFFFNGWIHISLKIQHIIPFYIYCDIYCHKLWQADDRDIRTWPSWLLRIKIVTIRLSYKLQWPEQRMIVNESADWGKEGEINISPENIEVTVSFWDKRNLLKLPKVWHIANKKFCFLCTKESFLCLS